MSSGETIKCISLLLFLGLSGIGLSTLKAQQAKVRGRVQARNGATPLEGAGVGILKPIAISTASDAQGNYELEVPANVPIMLRVRILGFETDSVRLVLKPGESKQVNFSLVEARLQGREFTYIDKRNDANIKPIDPILASKITTPGDAISTLIKTQLGVSSNNELSAQYSVRGGNYDENLVYVNGVEIYRPMLTRSGQQEGLNFANPDMVQSLRFSAGGFEARYGDKLSSVLDIQYKRPTRFAGAASASLLGATFQIEDAVLNNRLQYMFAARHRTTQYLLNSLDTRGEYRPAFTDVQGYAVYTLDTKWEVEFLGNFARNNYRVAPQDRETDFGTINQALRLKIFFDGKEQSEFDTRFGAFTANYTPNERTRLKWIVSGFQSVEWERTDVEGAYRIEELERNLGAEDFGNVLFNRGVGSFLSYIRNRLEYRILNTEFKGQTETNNQYRQWGVKAQSEWISDRLNEWRMTDSAGFSIPQFPPGAILFDEVVKSTATLQSTRISAYIQNQWQWQRDTSSGRYSLIAGLRGNYWTLNGQGLISPRVQFNWMPGTSMPNLFRRGFQFRASAGHYAQPPFYRELRAFDGSINRNLRAQESYHIIFGTEFDFTAWDRPFHFTSEVYYKWLTHIVPYEIDNVRIRYYADNLANGYARGIDFRVNGEFVKGIQSWANMSIMATAEDLKNDFFFKYFDADGNRVLDPKLASDSVRVEPGYIPRQTDQRFNFTMFFQDYLPGNESISLQMTMVFGSRLPVGPPDFNRYRDTLRMPPYRRVDIGVSKEIVGSKAGTKSKGHLKYFKTLSLSLEVFNLLGTNNTVSYLWVKDVTNRSYAVPNYLTNRLLNLRLQATF